MLEHDNTWPVALKFMSIGATEIHNNRQIVMTLDHDIQVRPLDSQVPRTKGFQHQY